MSTCSERHVRILPPAHIAPGAAAATRKCTTQPSAAPPTRGGTRRAMPPMPAQPPSASVSCHEKHATDTILRTFCTKTTSFAHFQSKNDRELTATASCYESPCQYPATRREKVFFKVGPIGPERAFRYPIDTLPIPGLREIRSRFASQLDALGPILDRFGPFLRTCATLPTRRPTPPLNSTLTSTLVSTRAGDMARDGALYSPTEAGRLNPRKRRIRGQKTPVQQGKNQVDVPCFHDDVRALLAHRARLPSQQWRQNPA